MEQDGDEIRRVLMEKLRTKFKDKGKTFNKKSKTDEEPIDKIEDDLPRNPKKGKKKEKLTNSQQRPKRGRGK